MEKILLIILPLFTLILGSYVTHLLDSKRESKRVLLEYREGQYRKFLENILGFFDGVWQNTENQQKFMRELYTHAPLYASSDVIRAANDFLATRDKTYPQKEKGDEYYRKLVIAIRKDLDRVMKEKSDLKEEDIVIKTLNN